MPMLWGTSLCRVDTTRAKSTSDEDEQAIYFDDFRVQLRHKIIHSE